MSTIKEDLTYTKSPSERISSIFHNRGKIYPAEASDNKNVRFMFDLNYLVESVIEYLDGVYNGKESTSEGARL